MLGNLGMGEMIVALIIVLVLFGAKRIPEISASLGQGIREFKRNMADEVEPPPSRPASSSRSAPLPSSDRVPYGATSDERPEPKRLL